jgi:DNA-binding NarL/FixJ family response regulator
MSRIRILIADDHEAVREGIRALMGREANFEVCGEAHNGRQAVELATKAKPDVVVLDITMPELDGLQVIRQIKRAQPHTEVVVYSAHSSEEIIEEVFAAGAKSYIGKGDSSRHLMAAIASVAKHKPFFTSEISEILFAKYLSPGLKKTANPPEEKLTSREREIVRLLAQSSSNKDIANTLGISVRTAETHRASLMRKLGIHSIAGLVRYAIRNHIIEP